MANIERLNIIEEAALADGGVLHVIEHKINEIIDFLNNINLPPLNVEGKVYD